MGLCCVFKVFGTGVDMIEGTWKESIQVIVLL